MAPRKPRSGGGGSCGGDAGVAGSRLSSPSPPGSSAEAAAAAAALVGRALEVHWPKDDAWYRGTIVAYQRRSGRHTVLYDDGEREAIVLKREAVRWIPSSAPPDSRAQPPRASECQTWGRTGRVRRCVVYAESDDDGEGLPSEGRVDRTAAAGSGDDDWAEAEAAAIRHRKLAAAAGCVEGDGSPSDSICEDEDSDEDEGGANSEEDAEEEEDAGKNNKRGRRRSATGLLTGGRKRGRSNAGGRAPMSAPAAAGNAAAVEAARRRSPVDARGGPGVPCSSTLAAEAAERFGNRNAKLFRFLEQPLLDLYRDRRDAKRRKPDHPDYDACTLHIPDDVLKSFSSGQRQWWQFKSKHMDKVLLFKMGKFYEMFEMDAHIGVRDLDLQYMKATRLCKADAPSERDVRILLRCLQGEQPHCGFPEKAYTEFAGRLVRKGYRVLVVEQVETPGQLAQRNLEAGTKDKVVKREVCAVITRATMVDGEMLEATPEPSYLLAVAEGPPPQSSWGTPDEGQAMVGACAIDCATSLVMVGQFLDDAARTRLSCVLAELRPAELVLPRATAAGNGTAATPLFERSCALSEATQRALRDGTRKPLVSHSSAETWQADKALEECRRLCHSDSGLPPILQELAASGSSAALAALGGAIGYLREYLLDRRILGLGHIESLPGADPLPGFSNEQSGSAIKDGGEGGEVTAWSKVARGGAEACMAMDSAALENLEILENSIDGGSNGTLLMQLDQCASVMGRKLLRRWLIRPLLQASAIVDRQNAIADLKGVAAGPMAEARRLLVGTPDMERLLSRICASSLIGGGREAAHVVLYEDSARRSLLEFTSVLKGCRAMVCFVDVFAPTLSSLTSLRLRWLLTPGQGLPPGLRDLIGHFEDAFDWVEAETTGMITPRSSGLDNDFDSADQGEKNVQKKLSSFLKSQHELLGKPADMTFQTVGKDQYVMEVPERLHSKVPRNYELRSQRKGYKRYWTPEIKELLIELGDFEQQRKEALGGILARLRAAFAVEMDKWTSLASCVAELDVLSSLALVSAYSERPMCRPTVIADPTGLSLQQLHAERLRHPVLGGGLAGGGSFVPNNTFLGGAVEEELGCRPHFMLLTGPNMGGKSTLLRQLCLAVVMAQVGADVPAESFRFTPVDRLFVRMGAKDHIMAGQSTFLLELSETATMLRNATARSLVALDELGRGTATSDGQAIAHAVLHYLAHETQCLGLFSTHYHRLADDHSDDPKVGLYHMACKVRDSCEGHVSSSAPEVTFLYKLAEGACPKSYGINVARLAGMPESVICRAALRAAELELKDGEEARSAAARTVGVDGQCLSKGLDDKSQQVRKSLSERERELVLQILGCRSKDATSNTESWQRAWQLTRTWNDEIWPKR
eukprot:SM000160S02538  [mRNA]  locus=s160:118607:128498:+ [translate_table: standard]